MSVDRRTGHRALPLDESLDGLPVVDDFVIRHEMDVITGSVLELVRCAGGWLFDRAMTGWHVTVLVDGDPDARPLNILGAQAVNLRSALSVRRRWPSTIAVHSELLRTDKAVHEHTRIAGRERTEIILWGAGDPGVLNNTCIDMKHKLSSAAVVYKVHALAAAAAPTECVDRVEALRAVAGSRGWPSTRALAQ